MPQPQGVPICNGPTGGGLQYAYCSSRADCAGIYECTSTGTYAFCMQWCASDNDCPNDYDFCAPLAPAVFVGGQQWGVCYNGVV